MEKTANKQKMHGGNVQRRKIWNKSDRDNRRR